jgi:hypothetical protein
MEDKTTVAVGCFSILVILVAILAKLAILGLVIWGLYEGIQYLSTLS